MRITINSCTFLISLINFGLSPVSSFKTGNFASSKRMMSGGDQSDLPSIAGSFATLKKPIYIDDSIMNKKSHGTCDQEAMHNLRWNVDHFEADRICCFNRHYAENSGYFQSTPFLNEIDPNEPTTFYDSVSGLPLFIAPRGRTLEQFKKESDVHGWPSFRDDEVVWENVRCLTNGETVSLGGTHLGHNLPDWKGNRYCINLVSVAGRPVEKNKEENEGEKEGL